MLDWILVNLFFLTIVLIGAGCTFLTFSVVRAAHLAADIEPWAFTIAAIVALVATGYITRWLHGVIERRL